LGRRAPPEDQTELSRFSPVSPNLERAQAAEGGDKTEGEVGAEMPNTPLLRKKQEEPQKQEQKKHKTERTEEESGGEKGREKEQKGELNRKTRAKKTKKKKGREGVRKNVGKHVEKSEVANEKSARRRLRSAPQAHHTATSSSQRI
jgi:hypothetical protein